jgi:hypothetical protein
MGKKRLERREWRVGAERAWMMEDGFFSVVFLGEGLHVLEVAETDCARNN